ncbi:MAG: prepilin-type N-terminal cleavage/methylation domain-containing protein [Thioalkalispiraceae bacterium]|jgi:MSHA pilin protein MshC
MAALCFFKDWLFVYMDRYSKQAGFTLIELVTVIVILGLLAVVMIPRFLSPSNFDSRTTADTLISSLRQAQQLAMSKATTANVTLTTDNSNKRIRISYNESGTQTIDVSISNNITITNATIPFLKSGAANIGGQVSIAITPNPRSVCVETTGYAHAC